jgi:Domain of unknown function (DUF4956)
MTAAYIDFAVDIAVNTAAIFLLAYALYFRRHRRADLLLGYVALNMGIFVAMSLLTTVRLDIALGFGLFAILSIIRLRSTSVTQQEVAYYFVALVMGLVNGLAIKDRWLILAINALLLLTMLVVDSKRLRDRARRLDITLDTVHGDDAALVADLESRLGGQVMYHQVNDIDYARGTMIVDVRYRAGNRPAELRVDERRMEVTLDVVHTDDTALVADLERRLGGQVLRHQVTEIDYVRDIMKVDVRFRPWVRRPEFRVEQPVAAPQAVNPQPQQQPHPRPQPVNPQAVNAQAVRGPVVHSPVAPRRAGNAQASTEQARTEQITGVRS